MVAVPTVVSGQEVSAEWGNAVASAVNQLRDNYAGEVSASGLVISRHSANPVHQHLAAGSTATLDWVVDSGVQAQYRVARTSNPTDPAHREYWNGSSWQAAVVWVPDTDTDVQLTGWSQAATWAVDVTVRDASNVESNTLTWSVLIGGGSTPGGNRPVITATPQLTALDNSELSADITVNHTGGSAPTQLWIRRTDPAGLVRYWDGDHTPNPFWATGDNWFPVAFMSGEATITLTGFAVGSSTLDIRARADSDSPLEDWSVIVQVAVSRSDMDGASAPVIVRTGDEARDNGEQTLSWTYSDPDDHTAASIELRRVHRASATAPTYWTGTTWQAAQTSVTSSTPSITVTLDYDYDYSVVVIDSNGDRSNRIEWAAPDTPPQPLTLAIPESGRIYTFTSLAGFWSAMMTVGNGAARSYQITRTPEGGSTEYYNTTTDTWDSTPHTNSQNAPGFTTLNEVIQGPWANNTVYTMTWQVWSGPDATDTTSNVVTGTWTVPDLGSSDTPSISLSPQTFAQTSPYTLTWTYAGAQSQAKAVVVAYTHANFFTNQYFNVHTWDGSDWVSRGTVTAASTAALVGMAAYQFDTTVSSEEITLPPSNAYPSQGLSGYAMRVAAVDSEGDVSTSVLISVTV